jgi:hypothetical protein
VRRTRKRHSFSSDHVLPLCFGLWRFGFDALVFAVAAMLVDQI